MVGAVLVYNGMILGEGYHRRYGEAHAEVNCVNDVTEENRHLIEESTLYVTLEPCSHYGKTPPCADMIIRNKIPRVVIGTEDIFKEVAGTGIQRLIGAGIEVVTGILEKECLELNKRFFTFHKKGRPFIILKWAQSANGKIGSNGKERIRISNDYTNRLVHKWRSQEASIMIGTQTALQDDPSLTTRLWKGGNPLRIVIDRELKLPGTLHIFDGEATTVVFNLKKEETRSGIRFIKIQEENFLPGLLHALFEMNIQSILVEGGATLLQSFIDGGWWDEARIIINEEMDIAEGISAPVLSQNAPVKKERYFSDVIEYFANPAL
jgi:diaminohydroxyphosphoribosylaminopyrimidine deaminase/5-amino-6-(5-phosphoribosylamino)uracil reductase